MTTGFMTMEQVKMATCLIPGTVVMFVVSSTGDGDPPDNCALFYAHLRKMSHPNNMLNGVRYTVLGLGDQNYTAFMEVPRQVWKRMGDLGESARTAYIRERSGVSGTFGAHSGHIQGFREHSGHIQGTFRRGLLLPSRRSGRGGGSGRVLGAVRELREHLGYILGNIRHSVNICGTFGVHSGADSFYARGEADEVEGLDEFVEQSGSSGNIWVTFWGTFDIQ
jgi:hypothetical protein